MAVPVGLSGGGKGGPGPVKALLEARGAGRGLWEVREVSKSGFLAVGRNADIVVEAVDASFLVAEGVLLHLQRWSLARGIFPNMREVRLCISLRGLPVILCDEEGISLLVKSFMMVEEGSLYFVPEGSLTTIDVTLQTYSSVDILLVISFSIGGAFIVRVFIKNGNLQGRRAVLGQ